MNKEDFINAFRKYIQDTRDMASVAVDVGNKDSEINQRMPKIITDILETAPQKIKEATEDEKTRATREFYDNARKYLLENIYPTYQAVAQDVYDNPDMLTRAKLSVGEKAINYAPTVIDKTVDIFKNAIGDAISPISDFVSEEDGASSQKTEKPAEKPAEKPKETQKDDDGEWIEYTYKPGDTFGQVILDQGLATSHGLWGADGDVAYYNQFLDPSKMASYGIPVGTTIRLKKRK